MNAPAKLQTVEDILDEMDAVSPLPVQAEVLRGQIQDDLNRRYWTERKQLMSKFEDRKEAVERDYARLSTTDFLAKYLDWNFQ